MKIANNILKLCLQNVYFINGTAYAGKSTMVRLLAERHDMIQCGENYHTRLSDLAATPELQPNMCYFRTMRDWQEFISRTPEVYARWIDDCSVEASECEIAELLRLSAFGKKIIVDTNISVENLREISDYSRVAIMLSPQSLSVDRFYDREDADKQFLLEQIRAAPDPEWAMANSLACLAEINSPERFAHFQSSGFFTLFREDDGRDTIEEVLARLERHFGLAPSAG